MQMTLIMPLRHLIPTERSALTLLRNHDVLPSTMKCPGKAKARYQKLMREREKKSGGRKTTH